jgi:hypothetical protein
MAHGDGPGETVGIPSLSDGFVIDDGANLRRVKALAATVPIEDLERAKGAFAGTFWGMYDLRTLAVAAIDWIALALGVSSGASWDAAVAFLTEQAGRQQRGRDTQEHLQVASRIIDRLVGASEVTRPYVDHASVPPVTREFSFRLVYEQLSASGIVHLRVSEEAINVLVDALDMDIADAQEAQESWMRRLIERGMLDQASAAAKQSRLRSIQFLERVQSIVRDTAADIAAHDWDGRVGEFLDRCLSHVDDRLQAERELRDLVAERREGITEGRSRIAANEFLRILADCHDRHAELHTFLISARTRFRAAQDAAFARAPGARVRYDLDADVVRVVLAARVGQAAAWAEDVLLRFVAPPKIVTPSFAVVLDEACAAPSERPPEEPEDQPLFLEPEDPWWATVWDAAAGVLEEVTHPVTLTELLGRAGEAAVALGADPRLSGAAVAHRAYELVGGPARPGLLAIPDGGHVGATVVDGPELLIVRLEDAHPGGPPPADPGGSLF